MFSRKTLIKRDSFSSKLKCIKRNTSKLNVFTTTIPVLLTWEYKKSKLKN